MFYFDFGTVGTSSPSRIDFVLESNHSNIKHTSCQIKILGYLNNIRSTGFFEVPYNNRVIMSIFHSKQQKMAHLFISDIKLNPMHKPN